MCGTAALGCANEPTQPPSAVRPGITLPLPVIKDDATRAARENVIGNRCYLSTTVYR